MTARPMVAVLAVVAALVAGGCGAGGSAPSTGEPAGASSSAAVAAQLDFTARTVAGTAFHGKQLAGKPSVLWFWSPWCPTCRAQSGGVSTLATTYAGKVNVVGVGGLDDSAAIRDFASGVSGFPHLDDAKGEVWKRFGITEQSSYVLLDAGGNVRFKGYLDDDELVKRVAELAG